MTFLAPWMLLAGGVAAGAVLALHLLTTRRPPPTPLPTARFVPASEMRALARASRPTDLLLLALRTLAVLAVGAAFAKPVLDAPGPSVRSVLLLEWTSALADPEGARALVASQLAEGDALVIFDSAARVLPAAALDTLALPDFTMRVAALSPAWIAARDAAAEIARGADSVRLRLFSTVNAGSIDAATPALRASWPGRVELTRLDLTSDSASGRRVELLRADPDDALLPAVQALGDLIGTHEVRVLRDTVTGLDSAWAVEREGRVLVAWPTQADSLMAPDGVAAFLPGVTPAPTLVAPLARRPVADGRVIARWRDGVPAATERALGARSCLRDVGIGLPRAGDLTLREPFDRFLAALTAPCGGRILPAVADSALPWLGADAALAPGPALAAIKDDDSLARWLLLAALLLLAVEQLWRVRAREVTS